MAKISMTTLNGREESVESVQRLISLAQSSICIFSQQLEPLLYNRPAVCEYLSHLVRLHRHARIRVIAQSTRAIANSGHCLIELAQRLPSSIQIRIPVTEELQHFHESWLIVDDHSMVRLDNPERYEGSVIENDRLHVKTQLEFFNHAWENSEQDQNTRRLLI